MLSSLLFYVSDLSIALIYTLILIFVNLFTPIFIGLDTLTYSHKATIMFCLSVSGCYRNVLDKDNNEP